MPDDEMRQNVLLNKIFTKFHKALYDLNADDVGVSFPEYKVLLGKMIRIHSTEKRLRELQGQNWLGGLSGYCKQSDILPIPSNVMHRTISRTQQNMTNAKLKRLIKRGSIKEENIKAYKAKMYATGLSEPFLELNSTSSGHKHRRYIKFGEILLEPKMGKFDTFGLSKTATVPIF